MPAHAILRRAVQRGLAVLGEPSSLDGAPCGAVHVARGVDFYAASLDQANDNHVAQADTARVEAQYNPRVGQVLDHPTEGRFRLQRLARDDGHARMFVVVQMPPA